MQKVRYFKLRENAIDPQRSHDSDAGFDVFYCPKEPTEVTLYIQEKCKLATGLKVEIPDGYYLEVKNRSGMAAEKGLLVGACVIDPLYNGELMINLHNVSGNAKQVIKPGSKIAQLILLPLPKCIWEESKIDDLNQGTKRGTSGFGSTGFGVS